MAGLIRCSVLRAVTRQFGTSSRVASAQMTVRDALNAAIDEEMERDDKVRYHTSVIDRWGYGKQMNLSYVRITANIWKC